ncbi:g8764 [Coccomyxa elongata]
MSRNAEAAALKVSTKSAAADQAIKPAQPSNMEEEVMAAVAQQAQIAVEEPSADLESEENGAVAQINILKEDLAAAIAAKEAAEGHSAQLQQALLEKAEQVAAYKSQASVLMLQRDRLAQLLRGSDLAKTSLQLALKSKEEQRKGLAQNAQVAVLVLQRINDHLISTRPTWQPHRLPAGAVVRFVEGNQEEGSYGTVFEAVVNLRCAAKMAKGPAGQAQLENEAAVLATIPPHTNIVHVYGLAPAPEVDEDVLVMELAEEDMFKYCSEVPTLTRDEVLSTCVQIVDGVQHVHNSGYVHSDIKPENCLRGDDGQVNLCDFGGARPVCDMASWGGTDGYLTPESCLRLEPVGRHDDIRGVCATLYEFWAGQKVSAMLSAAFASLPPATKKLVRQWCRSKGVGSTHDVWVAAAEHLGHIGIQMVEDQRKDLPEDLLDMVLLGIRESKKLSLQTMKERLMAAIDPHPCDTDGCEHAIECSSSIKLPSCLPWDACTPEASGLRAEGESCVGDAAGASAVPVHAPAAAADAAPEAAHGGRWFENLAERSEAAQEAAAGAAWKSTAEEGPEAASETGCSAGQRAVLEAGEGTLNRLPAIKAASNAAGSAGWGGGTEAAFEAAPRDMVGAAWAAGQQAASVAAPHVVAAAAWEFGRQASCSATQHGSGLAMQALHATAWDLPAQATVWPTPSMRAGAAWGPSAASELASVPHAVASIWGSGGQPRSEATPEPPAVWQPCAVDALRSAQLSAGNGCYNMWGPSNFSTNAGTRL